MRVAVVSGADAASAFPAAALAVRLVATDEVLAVTGERWVPLLAARHVNAVALPGVDGVVSPDFRDPAVSAEATSAVVERLRGFRPDLVIAEATSPVGSFAAEVLDLPWVQLHPHPLAFSPNAPGLERRGSKHLSRSEPASRPSPDPRGLRARNEARAGLGLGAVPELPQLDLVATLPALEPPRLDWPRRASVVGPLIFEPSDEEFVVPAGDGPVVLISPTTSGGDHGLLRTGLAALHGMRVVGASLEDYPEPVPDWATVGMGRIGPVLSRASVVVGSGGHGTIVRALTVGIPLVLAPRTAAQRALSERVADLGVALVLKRASSRALRRAVQKVAADDGMTERARAVARAVASADPVVLCHQIFAGRAA